MRPKAYFYTASRLFWVYVHGSTHQTKVYVQNTEKYIKYINTAESINLASNAITTPILIELGLQYATNIVGVLCISFATFS